MGKRDVERGREREKNIYSIRRGSQLRRVAEKPIRIPRAGHDGLPELWETICQAQYRPSPSSSNPLGTERFGSCPALPCSLSLFLSLLATRPLHYTTHAFQPSFDPPFSHSLALSLSSFAVAPSSTPHWPRIRDHFANGMVFSSTIDPVCVCIRKEHGM